MTTTHPTVDEARVADTPDLWFTVPGKPEPLRRHRTGTVGGHARAYDDPRNGPYADRIRWAWREAGGISLGDAPVILVVRAVFARPATHWTSRGVLSKQGHRTPYNTSKKNGDTSNIIKAVEDALNGYAWDDDSQIIGYAGSHKTYTQTPDEPARLEVRARALRTDVDWMGP